MICEACWNPSADRVVVREWLNDYVGWATSVVCQTCRDSIERDARKRPLVVVLKPSHMPPEAPWPPTGGQGSAET